MINYYQLKQQLLKAVSLNKNRQGLVYVQRIANGPTGTYLTHKWVRPDQLVATDRVLAGHVHLHPSHPQAPTNPKQYTNFSFAYPTAVKQQTAAFFNQMPNVQTFYQVLHNLGITYTAHPTSAGITLMRAKGALNAAIHNGLDLTAIPPKVLGLNNPVNVPVSQPTPTVTQQPQQPQPTPPSPSPIPQPTSPTAPVTSSSVTLPPRAKVASQASKDIATQFCNSFATRQDFYDALTQMGITWTQTNKPGPTFMWAKCFLAQYIENGFDPVSTWASLQNGTPQQPAPQPIAPPVSTAPAAPPVDNSLLEIPKDATPAQIELIKHINNMTDYATIRKCSVMGIVPEDDVAAEYITTTLLDNLKAWVTGRNSQKPCPKSVIDKFVKDMAEIGEKVTVKAKRTLLNNNNSGRLIEDLGITGCKKSIIADGLNYSFEAMFDMSFLIAPHKYVASENAPRNPFGGLMDKKMALPIDIMKSLNNAYSDYTTDQYFSDINGTGKTNLGYTGRNPEEYQKRYDPNKEGFVRYLQKIKQDNAGNAEVAAEVDRMIADYNEAMKIVGGNLQHLHILTQKPDAAWGSTKQYSVWDFGATVLTPSNYDPDQLKVTLEGANLQADAIINVLRGEGFSAEEIVRAINDIYYNDDLTDFRIDDKSGKRLRINIYNKAIDPVTGYNPLKEKNLTPSITGPVSVLALLKLQEQEGLSTADAQAKNWFGNRSWSPEFVENVKQWMKDTQYYTSFTQADAKKARDLIDGIFNPQATNPSAAQTTIMANILMAVKFNEATTWIAHHVDENPRNAQNRRGYDFTGNFDFYSPQYLAHSATRQKNSRNAEFSGINNLYTAQQLSNKITAQLNSTPQYSADYIQKLTQYYKDKAISQGMTDDGAIDLAKEDSFKNLDLTNNTDEFLDSPIKDVFYKTTSTILSYIPKMNQDPKFQDKINKKLNYVPFDFSATTQPRLKLTPKTPQQTTKKIADDQLLKEARQKLFESASLSLGTESEQVSEAMRKDINQNRFDYKAGEKSPDGKVFSGPFHRTSAQHNRCVLYNTRFFAIHNSIWEERFNKKHEELKAQYPNNPDMWTPMDLFHGTARSCAGNILGRDAGWWMGPSTDYVAAGKMLGPGAYFGWMLGKSVVYAGNVPYANIGYYGGDAPPLGDADGIIIMATVMRGDNYVKYKTTAESYTSVSTDSTRDWEMAVRDNALIFPHHFVDVSCRSYNKNVQVDADGNYLDNDGQITHDKNGKSVHMK